MTGTLPVDDRGVSEVVGAILVFGLIVTLIAVLQTQAVPLANEEVEFNHNQDVQGDMAEIDAAARRSLRSNRAQSVAFRYGTTYPSRLVFFNPSDPEGVLRTSRAEPLTIEAAGSDDVVSPDSDVNAYLGGSLQVDVRSLSYTPQYNNYGNAPTTRYEYGVLYNDRGDGETFLNDHRIISGTSISLVTTPGDLDRGRSGTASVNVEPAEAPPRTVEIESSGSGNIVIEMPTDLSEAFWDELAAREANVVDTSVSGGTVVVELRAEDPSGDTITYDLEMPRVTVARSGFNADPEYVTTTEDPVQVRPGGTARLRAEVRDEFNNPVPGEEVQFFDPDGNPIGTVEADDDGVATLEWTSPETGVVDVDATSVGGSLGETQLDVEITGALVGPVSQQEGEIQAATGFSAEGAVNITVTNDDPAALEVKEIRYVHGSVAPDSLPVSGGGADEDGDLTLSDTAVQQGPEYVEAVAVVDPSVGVPSAGQFENVDGPGARFGEEPREPEGTTDAFGAVNAGDTASIWLDLNQGAGDEAIAAGDYVMFEVVVVYEGGHRETYEVHANAT